MRMKKRRHYTHTIIIVDINMPNKMREKYVIDI